MYRLVFIFLGVLIWSHSLVAMAHPLDITSTTIRAEGESLLVETRLTARQVAVALLGREHDFEGSDVMAVEGDLLRTFEEGVQLRQGEELCSWKEGMIHYAKEDTVQLLLEGVVVQGRFECSEAKQQPLILTMSLFTKDFPDQQNIVVVAGEVSQQHILTPVSSEVELSELNDEVGRSNSEGPFRSFWRFVWLGVEHVAIGYDHILFMVGIYLVVRKLRQLLYVTSSFTVAHSITLIAATLGWVTLPSAIVETAIAATIVYIGIENIVRRDFSHRPLMTFGLGLIHGLGFSSVLREIGIPEQYLLLDLVAFNVGVEIGQLAIVIVLLPAVWWVSRRPRANQLAVYWLSIGISIAGLVWFLERFEGIL